jgi:hypothetical protein
MWGSQSRPEQSRTQQQVVICSSLPSLDPRLGNFQWWGNFGRYLGPSQEPQQAVLPRSSYYLRC